MPAPVAHGGVNYRACAECHLANGRGKPDTAALNALPAAYIEQQMEEFRNGRRDASVPGMSVRSMLPVAANISPAEAKDAAEYFASIPPAKWVQVIEADVVPKTELAGYRFIAIAEGGTEPIGNRIVELPVDANRTSMRDASSGFIAYVPKGSIAKGKILVETGGDKTTACATCHGTGLHGTGGLVPPIAGRSPSAIGRQLYDFKTGARDGSNAALMKGTVAALTDEDILNIVSYLTTLPQYSSDLKRKVESARPVHCSLPIGMDRAQGAVRREEMCAESYEVIRVNTPPLYHAYPESASK
ncbi:c-type cytochrome [Terriglobus roseus]|uniref:Cytochrome C oxidase, cbb3-type, subunit III n=1 Tax=Terriglobus roseus TaxID=392734 RepID=A0A1H4K4D3_9BACT|nr:c-type cytochrome [Terriglobus roseus]SEB52975.1 Cytochrome C oxidase, cbb3-type, subunit III [Terriglobus roseus]